VTSAAGASRLRRRAWSLAAAVVALAAACALLQLFAIRPFLPPAGHGARLAGESSVLEGVALRLLTARPPAPPALSGPVVVRQVPDGSPAAAAGLREGDVILRATNLLTAQRVDLSAPAETELAALQRWRDAYWLGTRGALEVDVARGDGTSFTARVDRPPAWSLSWSTWLRAMAIHAGPLLEMAAIIGAAIVLLLLRPRDATALPIVLALACMGTSTVGSLVGGEAAMPPIVRAPLTVFAWLAMPLAFPLIALAILHFPRKARLLSRHPWLYAVPVVVALPMVIPAAATALFLSGVDALGPVAVWDATHPEVFYATFAGGLLVNIAAMVEGVWRYKHNADTQERRRVAFATATLVLATVAFTVRDGIPALSAFAGMPILLPWWARLPLHLMTALAGAGITYAVAVNRVLAPRVVVRQSLQYALARKTLAVAAALPAVLLIVALYNQRDRSLAEIVSGQPILYVALLVLIAATLHSRDAAKAWLDRRFFRQEYDARAVLLSLSGRIPFETDPNELMALVVHQIDAALTPSMVAVLVADIEPGTLVPVSVLHGTADTLPQAGGIGSMLTWSDAPLELHLDDERSAGSRLPPDEVEWLRCTGAVLFVPLSIADGGARRLLGALVLGGKRSGEPYSPEDRALLSSIGAQVTLGLDIARLRRRQSLAGTGPAEGAVTMLPPGGSASGPLVECQTCSTCHDAGVATCPHDGTPLRAGRLPRVVEAKYRVDLVLGRGGMGAVYRAHDMRLERDVAIKVVRAELLHNPDARSRFRREAQLVARLQHPGIVSVFDYGTLPEGAAFLVMEYVRGRDLRAVLRERGTLPPGRVAQVLAGIAEAVDAAHRMGVLHRDLKPENVLVSDDERAVKVLDFGVAKLIDADTAGQTLTLDGQPIGTPAYMAPEQLVGGAVTTRTDVFALGVMAYEMVSGQTPFGLGPIGDIALRQRDGAPPLEADRVPGRMADAIAAAISVDPVQRPASAAPFAAMLQ
jgi:predicted Ser/Thr protein kinase/GAF domain-containing protein